MDEKRQNEVICKWLGWEVVGEGYILLASHHSIRHPWISRDDNMARLLREAVIKAGAGLLFVEWLNKILNRDNGQKHHATTRSPLEFMQATAAQQAEAALRAVGKWEETP